jgi:hypothetical protein
LLLGGLIDGGDELVDFEGVVKVGFGRFVVDDGI